MSAKDKDKEKERLGAGHDLLDILRMSTDAERAASLAAKRPISHTRHLRNGANLSTACERNLDRPQSGPITGRS